MPLLQAPNDLAYAKVIGILASRNCDFLTTAIFKHTVDFMCAIAHFEAFNEMTLMMYLICRLNQYQ